MNLYVRLWHPLIRHFWLAFYRLMGGYRVEGVENIPRQGPLLVACNHISVADPLAVYSASPRPLHYMAAKELHDTPVLGPAIRFLRAFPVSRGEKDREAMEHTRRLLRDGEAVVIYPEGGCSRDGRLQPLYPGVASLALKEGCPVMPVVIQGTNGMLPVGARFVRPHPKRIRFGAPLYLGRLEADRSPREQVKEATARIRRAMLDLGALPGDEDPP